MYTLTIQYFCCLIHFQQRLAKLSEFKCLKSLWALLVLMQLFYILNTSTLRSQCGSTWASSTADNMVQALLFWSCVYSPSVIYPNGKVEWFLICFYRTRLLNFGTKCLQYNYEGSKRIQHKIYLHFFSL